MALTVAAVPTGIKTGVSMLPWGVWTLPLLALDLLSVLINSYVTAAISTSCFVYYYQLVVFYEMIFFGYKKISDQISHIIQ
jgi:hypothetical protein